MLRKGTYRFPTLTLEVLRDIPVGGAIMSHDVLIDGRVPEPGSSWSRELQEAVKELSRTMPTYNELIDRIAGHLSTRHGCPLGIAGEAAARLVQDCNLSSILVFGIAKGVLGDSPRQVIKP